MKKDGFHCWICGRLAKLIKLVPYPSDHGGTVVWDCKKCGRRAEGT